MSAAGEFIAQVASLGVELIDELTGGALLGASEITVFRAAVPGQPIEPTQYLVGQSRWVFENLTEEVRLVIDATGYLSETLVTGQTATPLVGPPLPVPAVAAGPGYVQLTLRPRTGYPFSPAMTRVVGVVLQGGAPLVGATVALTPRFGASVAASVAVPPPFVTLTADDGQFVVWLFPNINQEPPTAVSFDVAVNGATVITNQPLVSQAVNGVTIVL